jgi:hypothetical protein
MPIPALDCESGYDGIFLTWFVKSSNSYALKVC